MRKRSKRLLSLLLLICMVLSMGVPTFAATTPKLSKKTYRFSYASKPYKGDWRGMKIKGMTLNTEVKNLKSSNKKVAVPSWSNETYKDRGDINDYITVDCLKKGKTVITGDFYESGKYVRSFKATVRVYKYKNPAKSFKVGKTNFTKKFNAKPIKDKQAGPHKTMKVNIKAKRGWKLKSITFDNYAGGKPKKIKNGKKIKTGDFGGALVAKFYNKKEKRYEDLSLYFWAY